MKIFAVKMIGRTGDASDFVQLDLERDVNYIELWRVNGNSGKVFAYYTGSDSYLAISTLRDAAHVYKSHGFVMYDKSTIVNTKKIKDVMEHGLGSIIIFFDGSHRSVRKKLN